MARRGAANAEYTSAFGGIADMAGLATGSTKSRMTQGGYIELSKNMALAHTGGTLSFASRDRCSTSISDYYLCQLIAT